MRNPDIPSREVLAPIESVDAQAAYRARFGPISRGVLFLFRYVPLTLIHSFFAAFVFVGVGVQGTVVGLGVIGDLLRWRFAPDLKVPDKDWVSLFCDGKWSATAERAYVRRYWRLESLFLAVGVGYQVLFILMKTFLPPPVFNSYLDMFALMHDWGREHLYMAGEISAILLPKGYGYAAAFLVHLQITSIFLPLIAVFLYCIGGGSASVKAARRGWLWSINKNISWFRNITRNRYFVFSALVCIISASMLILFTNRPDIFCRSNILNNYFCPQFSKFQDIVKYILIGSLWPIFILWIHFSTLTLKAWSIRIAQLEGGNKQCPSAGPDKPEASPYSRTPD